MTRAGGHAHFAQLVKRPPKNEQQILSEVAATFEALRKLTAIGNFVWYEAAQDYESKYQNHPEVFDKSLRRTYWRHAEEPNGAAHFANMALRRMEPPSRVEDVAAFARSVEARVAASLPLDLGVSATVRRARELLKRLNELKELAAQSPHDP